MKKPTFLLGGPALFQVRLFRLDYSFFHNVRQNNLNGSALLFYLPKLESHLESAELWNDVFKLSADTFAYRASPYALTVLIATILAAFEMHEILSELTNPGGMELCGAGF